MRDTLREVLKETAHYTYKAPVPANNSSVMRNTNYTLSGLYSGTNALVILEQRVLSSAGVLITLQSATRAARQRAIVYFDSRGA